MLSIRGQCDFISNKIIEGSEGIVDASGGAGESQPSDSGYGRGGGSVAREKLHRIEIMQSIWNDKAYILIHIKNM